MVPTGNPPSAPPKKQGMVRPSERTPKRRNKLSTRKQKYAADRAAGHTKAEAGRRAGLPPKNARKNAFRWEQDPLVREEIARLLKEAGDMSAEEVRGRLAAQARGDLPTKATSRSGFEFDMHAASVSVARIHRLFAEDAPPPAPAPGLTLNLNIAPEKMAALAAAGAKVLDQFAKEATK